jgi:hypothetical protein
MFADFPQRLAIFESNVAGDYILNGPGHNHSPHAYRTPRAIKSKIFLVR